MTGNRFNYVVALRQEGKAVSGDLTWTFLCDCGNEFIANGYYVRCGKVQSCQECSKERVRLSSVKHGLSDTTEYRTWANIKTRCYNKKSISYMEYGGRGVVMCDRWLHSFDSFLVDMGNRPSNKHSIDRTDFNGNYEPVNCRWATQLEQANNKRNNVKLTIEGVTKTIGDWSRHYGEDRRVAWLRYKQGVAGAAIFATTRRLITHNGITDTIPGWGNRVGIKANTLAMRINKYGWPINVALTKEVGS